MKTDEAACSLKDERCQLVAIVKLQFRSIKRKGYQLPLLWSQAPLFEV